MTTTISDGIEYPKLGFWGTHNIHLVKCVESKLNKAFLHFLPKFYHEGHDKGDGD